MIIPSPNNPNAFTADASDIGLCAGVWPESFEYRVPKYGVLKFFNAGDFRSNGEFAGRTYVSLAYPAAAIPSCTITVFND